MRSGRRHVVFIGGGHTHVDVLKRWRRQPPAGVRVTVVVDRPIAVYSGLVPDVVAGRSPRSACEIDVVALVRRLDAARLPASCVEQAAVAIEADARRITLADGSTLPYDLLSIDVGSTVAGLDLEGVREHALATRPIGRFLDAIETWVEALRVIGSPPTLAVVGAGAAGVELAFCLRRRLDDALAAQQARVVLIDNADRPLVDGGARARHLVTKALIERDVEFLPHRRVAAVTTDRLIFRRGSELETTGVVWASGAAPGALARASDLQLDARGFFAVAPTLCAIGRHDVFATGDCAALIDHPRAPKAGVLAVRQAPILDANLRATIAGRPPRRRFRPQRAMLRLLNLGDGTAIAEKWGLAARGRWAQRLKDRIDRRFVATFR
ncbi:MAG: FAD-dependent oxidoreductase [Acidobacteriota bacterium]